MEEITFEKSLAGLEAVVKKLEDGNIPLDQMVSLYEEGSKLGRQCIEMLESYEGKLAQIQLPVEEEEIQ
ncbi:MAG: exodeoxyribonuclease VII small subunit [Clostridiales bacterium]|jgi:exodeoxyribonuclease VII small subunit|nr:exodeoxyribonuclease VII small subunit [Clostridiales bacterium]